ncbi:MAG: Fic family protein, partial [Acidimicrobiales bacterium]
MSPGPDDAYAPLDGPDGWPAPAKDALTGAVGRLRALEDEAPAWTDMVRHGMLLAAAYQSGALAGLYGADDAVSDRLLSGVAGADVCGPQAAPHVLSNHAALGLARERARGRRSVTEAWVRRLHVLACAPQVTHPVLGDHGVHDHVLGHGDYKHHPNHVRTRAGAWSVSAPVDRVAAEMAVLVAALGGDAFAALDPVAQAAYALYAVTHVGPFAAGNGRVARALASVPLFDAAAIPLAVPPPSAAYRDALAAAGRGEPSPLVDFVARRCAGLVDRAEEARAA